MKNYLTTILLLMAYIGFGQTIEWTGEGDGIHWSDVDNWSPTRLPDEKDEVFIADQIGTFISIDVSADVKSLTLENAYARIEFGVTITLLETDSYVNELTLIEECYLINNGTLIVESGHKSMDISSQSLFTNNGMFTVLASDMSGITSTGNCINNGTIQMESIPQGAIHNKGTFTNNGTIDIENVETFGIRNDSTFLNRSVIVMDDLVDRGFINNDSLEQNELGVMQISNVIDLLNNGFLNNPNAVVVNMGKIEVSHTEDGFVNLGGHIINHDSIISHDNIDYDLVNGGELDNLSGATIYLHSITTAGGVGYYNLGASSRIDNYGKLQITEIGETGILNDGYLFNYDTISIHALPGDGIVNNHYFQNLSNAQVEIDRVYGAGNSAFINNQSTSQLFNSGTLIINDIKSYGLQNKGTFINYDTLSISHTVSNGIDNHDRIENGTSGNITIAHVSNSTSQGINNNSTSAELTNQGKIQISDIAGSGIQNSGIITNQDSLVVMDNGNGINNADSLYNDINGTILISDIIGSSSVGFNNYSLNSRLVSLGFISIDGTDDIAIKNLGYLYINDTLSIFNA